MSKLYNREYMFGIKNKENRRLIINKLKKGSSNYPVSFVISTASKNALFPTKEDAEKFIRAMELPDLQVCKTDFIQGATVEGKSMYVPVKTDYGIAYRYIYADRTSIPAWRQASYHVDPYFGSNEVTVSNVEESYVSIYEQLNKIDDDICLDTMTEEFIDVCKLRYKYISDDDSDYSKLVSQGTMTQEEIDAAYDNEEFPDIMWLDGSARITQEEGYDGYQVSFGMWDDYAEYPTIEECRKHVEGFHYAVRWID